MAANDMFRAEALAHHQGGEEHGDIIRYDDKWTRLAYSLVVVACLAGFAFISLFTIDDWSSGPCIVQFEGRRVLAASLPSSVESVEVKPGSWVEPGQILVRMQNQQEAAELARATKEYELQLVRVLRDPNDQSAKENLVALRSRRDQAKNDLEGRTITSTTAGVISDVRVKPGQHLNPGDVIVAITPKANAQASVVAVVPAEDRPMLEIGQKMRVEFNGFHYEYLDLEVEKISDEAIGAAEVARILLGGQQEGDKMALNAGGKVLVTAKLPSNTFNFEGQQFSIFDGQAGTAEIRVRREPILMVLVPYMRSLLPGNEVTAATPIASPIPVHGQTSQTAIPQAAAQPAQPAVQPAQPAAQPVAPQPQPAAQPAAQPVAPAAPAAAPGTR